MIQDSRLQPLSAFQPVSQAPAKESQTSLKRGFDLLADMMEAALNAHEQENPALPQFTTPKNLFKVFLVPKQEVQEWPCAGMC